jgi:hypothetical protein
MVSIMNKIAQPSQTYTPERYSVTKRIVPRNFTPHFQREEAVMPNYLTIHNETIWIGAAGIQVDRNLKRSSG